MHSFFRSLISSWLSFPKCVTIPEKITEERQLSINVKYDYMTIIWVSNNSWKTTECDRIHDFYSVQFVSLQMSHPITEAL